MEQLIAHWDGKVLVLGRISEGGDAPTMMLLESDGADGQLLPQVQAEGPAVETLLWPVERLLFRPFYLPLSHMRLLDETVLGQELEDQCGIEANDWWLAWQAAKSGEGLAGMVFGLPEVERQALAEHSLLNHCTAMLPDAWIRLQAQLPEDAHAATVLDADHDGLFVGVFRQGVWRGMRRINISSHSRLEDAAEDVIRSLAAMGHEPADDCFGRIGEALSAHLLERLGAWRGEVMAELPARAEASIAAAATVSADKGPNFRRSTWSPATAWLGRLSAWRRTAMLATLAVLLSVMASLYSLHGLRGQIDEARAAIEAAFHRGLPQETVMLDPIAQLRAAGGVSTDASSWVLLRQLRALGTVRKRMGDAKLSELHAADGSVSLVGDVTDFAAVDQLRELLAGELDVTVRIDDTERDSGRVRYRLSW